VRRLEGGSIDWRSIRGGPGARADRHTASRFEVEDLHVEPPPIEEVIARFYALHALEG
jgi:hypothetical protein